MNEKGKEKKDKYGIYIRVPESLYLEIQDIVSLTGLTINAICLELLRPAIKQKLKDLRKE
jgi:hypothetical protein